MITGSLKLSASAVNSETPLAAAAKICGVPRRTLRNWIRREGSLKKLGRNAGLPADTEEQLHQRIIRLQQVSFGLNSKSLLQVCSSNMRETAAESVESQNSGKGLVCSLRRNPGLTLRKAGSFSYGRLIIFSRETLHDFFKLLTQTVDAMKLHQRSHLTWSVDETGFKLLYSPGNQKLLAVKGSKRFTILLRGAKGETLTVVVCMSASGSSWILPVVLCKRKYRRV
jgi:hypothetical protein